MDNTGKQNQPNKSAANGILHFYRNWVMNILIFLVIVLFFVFRLYYAFPAEMNRYYNTLLENVQQAVHYEQYENDADQLYTTMQDQEMIPGCNLMIEYIEEGLEPQRAIDVINENSDDFDSFFYLKSDGTLLSSASSSPLELTEAEKDQLLTERVLQPAGGTLRYYAVPNGEDWMILRIDESCVEHLSGDMLQFISLDGFVFSDETQEVLSADDDTIIPENFASMYQSENLESDIFADTDMKVILISPYTEGIAKYTHMMLAAIAPLSYRMSGYSLCAYIPCSQILRSFLLDTGLPSLLCLAFIFLIIFGSLHFRQTVYDSSRDAKIIRLPFNCYLNLELVSQIGFMQITLGLLVIVCSTVMLLLGRFATYHETAEYNLSQLIETQEACQETFEECRNVYLAPASGMAQSVNLLLSEWGLNDSENAKTYMKQYVESDVLEEISIYDRSGENVFTTADHVGYPLTKNTDSPQYEFWDLMTGDVDHVLTYADSDSDVMLYAVSRSDAVGVVVLTLADAGLGDLAAKLSPTSVAANMYSGSSFLYMSQEMTDTVYQIASDGTATVYGSQDLPVLTNQETFCGFRTINGSLCFVNGLGTETQSIFYIDNVSDVLSGVLQIVLSMVFFLLIACLLDFLGCAVYTVESGMPQKPERRKSPHPFISWIRKHIKLPEDTSDSLNIIWKHCLYSTLGLIVFTLLLDYFLDNNALLTFLLGNSWERGVSIFSSSLIVLSVLVIFTISQALKFFFSRLEQNLMPRSATVSQMVYSLINIVLIVWLLMYSANQVGIDASTILASLGITGLVLGIAAKDTINDMMRGFFIILDGQVRVGDYVEVGGFYGKITQIRIRTTKISNGNQEKSFNNSEMKNVLNHSRGVANVTINFSVPADTDLKHLSEIIEGADSRFQAYCDGKLKSKIRFWDLTDFNAHSVTCCIIADVDECDRKELTWKCKHVLKDILDENQIHLA